jgi:DegV family protein with EDD domain
MTIKLVTDSTCDLPPTLLDDLQIQVIPINIQFGAKAYKENLTITPDIFYQKIAFSNLLPKTSQPAVGEFVEMYIALAETADEILSIHLTSKLSGTYQSAKLAASIVANKVKVSVIDSLAGSAGLGWMVHEAAHLIDQGKSTREIKRHLEAKRESISIFFVIDTLKYAQMSGRVGKLRSVVGALLNIKPIIGLEKGLIDVSDKTRSHKNAMQRIVALTKEKIQDRPVNVAVVHAQAAKRAETLLDLAQSNLTVRETFIQDVAISLATHFGPGTLGLVAYPTQ